MCGIAGIYLKDEGLLKTLDIDKMATHMLESIEHRGGDASGIVALTDEGVGLWQKAACRVREFNEERRPVPENARTILLHTRWATQGSHGFMENNHPIKRGPFFVIHNGHVHNDHEMFIEAKRRRYGRVDSEAIAAHLSSKGHLWLLHQTMEKIDGAAAVAAVDERYPGEIALARGETSPLFVVETKRIVLFGSTQQTVVSAHEKFIGKLRKTNVKEIDQGRMLYITPRGTEVINFAVKIRPKAWSWLEKNYGSDGQKQLSSSLIEEDWMQCDVCSAVESYQNMRYVLDKDAGETMALCPVCYDWLATDPEDDTVIDVNPTDPRFADAVIEN